jgi:hypothetical protein
MENILFDLDEDYNKIKPYIYIFSYDWKVYYGKIICKRTSARLPTI